MKKKHLNFATDKYLIFTGNGEDVYAGLKTEVLDKVQQFRIKFQNLYNVPDSESLVLFRLNYNEQLSGWDIVLNQKVEIKVNELHEEWVQSNSTLEQMANSIKK